MHNNALFLIFVAIGALFIAIGLILLLRNLRFAARSQAAVGTVIDLEESHDEGVSYSPVVTFTTTEPQSPLPIRSPPIPRCSQSTMK